MTSCNRLSVDRTMAVVESAVSSLVNVSGQLPLGGSLASMQVCIREQSCYSWIERIKTVQLGRL
jgi:hypothetical protein